MDLLLRRQEGEKCNGGAGKGLKDDAEGACTAACTRPADDRDLRRVADAWTGLPRNVKEAILLLISARDESEDPRPG